MLFISIAGAAESWLKSKLEEVRLEGREPPPQMGGRVRMYEGRPAGCGRNMAACPTTVAKRQ
jgi:hypothetical protein